MRSFLESLYRSPFGRIMSAAAWAVARLQRPFMAYGIGDPQTRLFRKYTRISSTAAIVNRPRLAIGENVWIWHHSILDATEGLVIEEGVQIGAWVGIFTHGSENSIRLLGSRFVDIPNALRKGYTRGSVKIGAYSFIGAGSVILPGVTIGKGCLIGAGTLVAESVPDYSLVLGRPGRVRGSTIDIDRTFFQQEDFSSTYYDHETLQLLKAGRPRAHELRRAL